MKARDIRDAIVDALEQVGDRQDYYILNHISREQRETLDGMIKSWLSSIGIKSEG